MEQVRFGGRPRRRCRSRDWKGEMDGDPGGPGVWLQLRAARPGRGVRVRRWEGDVRARLRGGVDEGDEPRSLRPGLKCGAGRAVSRGTSRSLRLALCSLNRIKLIDRIHTSNDL